MRAIIVGSVASLLWLPAVAQMRDQRDYRGWDRGGEPTQMRRGDSQGGTKLCSAYSPNAFRDTIPVPASWSPEDCTAYAASLGAAVGQLGCIFEDGDPKVVWGPVQGGLPALDCGWAPDDQAGPRGYR